MNNLNNLLAIANNQADEKLLEIKNIPQPKYKRMFYEKKEDKIRLTTEDQSYDFPWVKCDKMIIWMTGFTQPL